MQRTGRFASFPPVTLWVWERPDDVRKLDPHRYAVAYLAETIVIRDGVTTTVRREPLLVAPDARLVAVVRIEARPGTADLSDPELPGVIAGMIAAWAHEKGTAAVQVDFDATRSQRLFYARMLGALRNRLPVRLPLSITALASWCAFDDWIASLPVDEAVPMFFRMGPDHPPSRTSGWRYPIREPLCRNTVGLSTDEAWPDLQPGTRLYVFHPRPWNPVALTNLEHSLGL